MKKKLEQWKQNGLIDQETVDRILAHEKENSRPLFLYAVSGLAALSILIGLVALVAANWDGISDGVKLGLDLAVGCALAGTLQRKALPDWVREVLLTILGGWTLASIALIGQVYQLGGKAPDAWALWCLLTIPIVVLGNSRVVASVWFVGYGVTLSMWVDTLLKFLGLEDAVVFALIPAVAWLLIFVFRGTRLGTFRPHLASVFGGAAALVLGFGASVFGMIGANEGLEENGAVWAVLLLSTGLAAGVWRRLPAERGSWRDGVVATQGMILLPFALNALGIGGRLEGTGFNTLFAVIAFVGYWAIVARAALHHGQRRVFRVATLLIGLRLIGLYLELFENLLGTSFVFITGGALTLWAIRFWHKNNQNVFEDEGKEATQ